MMKPSKNNTPSTKWRQPGGKFTLSRLCRWLALAVAVKLAVFFVLAGNFSAPPPAAPDRLSDNGVVNLAALPALSEAKAQEDPQIEPQVEPPLDQAVQDSSQSGAAANSTTGAEPMDGFASGQSDALLRDALERRSADLDRREAELNRLEQALNEKLLNMQAMEARIETMLREAKTVRDEKMRHLVDVYSNMKAQQAAQVLETLDERTAVQILAGMRGRQAGEILTYVRPEKAARLSEMLTRIQLPFQQ